jgi:hypothetical protein
MHERQKVELMQAAHLDGHSKRYVFMYLYIYVFKYLFIYFKQKFVI